MKTGDNGNKESAVKKGRSTTHYSSVFRSDVPQSRKGKHHQVVGDILGDVENLADGRAIKVPRKGLGYSIQQLRSALTRGADKRKYTIATAADDDNLYIWRKSQKTGREE